MKRVFEICAAMMCMILLLVGCGVTMPEDITVNSVVIHKDGSIKAYYIRDFERDIYKVSELYDMALAETKEYCALHGDGCVMLDSVDHLGEDTSKVRAVFEYKDAATYTGYNEIEFFYGLVGETEANIAQAKSVKDGTSADRASLSEKHVVVTKEKALIYCPYTVSYVSEGASVDENGAVDTRNSDGEVIIIMGK